MTGTTRKVQINLPCALLLILIIFIIDSYISSFVIEYYPSNGKGQSFNGVARILAGELPGRDFLPYLGTGTTFLLSAFTFLTGGDFHASIFSNKLIHYLAFSLSIYVILYLSAPKLYKTYTLYTTIISVSVLLMQSNIISTTAETFNLYNRILGRESWSDYGTRSLIPYALVLIIIFLRKLDLHIYKKISFMSSVLAFSAYWSNDFGLFSTFEFFLISPALLNWGNKDKRQVIISYFMLYSITPLFCIMAGLVLTGGYLFNYVHMTMSVSEGQWWYFLSGHSSFNQRMHSLQASFILLISLFYLTTIFKIITDREVRIYYVTNGLLSIALLGGGSLSYFVGVPDRSYFSAVSFHALLSIFLYFLPVITRALAQFSVIGRYFPVILKYTALAGLVTHIAIISASKIKHEPPNFYVEEIGGRLPIWFEQTVNIARRMRAEVDHLPPDQRVVSSYRGIIDYIVGSENPAGFDYFIHALGIKNQASLMDKFRDNPAKFATTQRIDFDGFGWWNWQKNWLFYRYIIQHYAVDDIAFYAVIWRRADRPSNTENDDLEVRCQVEALNATRTMLTITGAPKSYQSAEQSLSSIKVVDVSFDLRFDPKTENLPIRLRPLVLIDENIEGNLPYPSIAMLADPYRSRISLPIEYTPGKPHIIALSIADAQAQLSVSGCKAEILAPLSVMGKTFPLVTSTFSGTNWRNGVYIPPQGADARAGIKVENADIYAYGILNSEVFLPNGDRRKIITTEDGILWLSGAPLDPLIHGAPNRSILFLR